MPRFALELIEKSVFISASQEEAFEAIAGWDNGHQAVDDTPSQPADAESTQISSQLPEKIIPRDISSKRTAAIDAAMIDEDSYNEAFESDRSQSPSRTLSWSLGGGGGGPVAGDGCSKDPKSPTSVTPAVETRKSPFKLKVTGKVKLSTRLRNPPEAAATIASRVEVLVHQEESRAEQAAQETSGRREGFDNAYCGGGVVKPTTVEFEGRPSVRCTGIRVAGSPSVRDVPAVGSGRSSAFRTLRRNEQDSEPAFPAENDSKFGFEGVNCVRSTPDVMNQMTNSVQANTQVLLKRVLEDDHSEKDPKSGDDFERTKFCVQYELNSSEMCGERRVRVGTDPIPSSGLRDELERHAGLRHEDELRLKVLSTKEKSNEISCSQSSARTAKVQSVQTPGAGVTPDDGRQHSPPSSLRPSRALQEKLEKLRSQSGNKRTYSGILDLLADRLREERENISSNTVLEAIKLRSGERSAREVTAADLLNTALDVGISLPSPFHRNYFRE